MLGKSLIKAAAGNAAEEVETDPYFNQTVLLLHGDGTNGAQNNTFLDSSTNNFTITRNGNTTQGTFSPFSQSDGNWSNYFNSGTDYLQKVSGAESLRPGTGDFTFEFWHLNTSPGAYDVIFELYEGGSRQRVSIQVNSPTSQAIFVLNGSVVITTSGVNPFDGQWHHHAIVRNGTNLTYYIDGIARGSTTDTTNISLGNSFIIGEYSAGSYNLVGYVSNFRAVIGTAVYTSAFTPPTSPLTAITNTQLLTCQSNRFVDNSSNAFAITVNGNTSVQPFSPFAPSAAYDASVNGGSGYFDGTGDYLTLSGNPVVSTNFTIEFLFYMPSWGDRVFLSQGGGTANFNTTNGLSYQIYATASTFYVQWADGSGGNDFISTATSGIALNAWHHVAIGNDGTTTRVWIDGVSIGSDTGTPTWGSPTTKSTYIGYISYSSSYVSIGYISNVRIVTSDVYGVSNTTITIPTAPLTAVSGTSLLCNFTNAGIFDNTGKNNLETVGNAQIDTTTKQYGTGSMEFDGTGDWLISPSTDIANFGSDDFTIEFWFYSNSTASVQNLIDARPPSTTGEYLAMYLNTDGTIRLFTQTSDRIISSAISTGTWYHIALARASGSTKLFIDGSQEGSTYSDSNVYVSSRLVIGAGHANWYEIRNPLNGFIDDLRITKGVARYTTTFTPPDKAFPDQ